MLVELRQFLGRLQLGLFFLAVLMGFSCHQRFHYQGSLQGYVEKTRRLRKSNCCKIAGICILMERMRMVFIFLEPFLVITSSCLELRPGFHVL